MALILWFGLFIAVAGLFAGRDANGSGAWPVVPRAVLWVLIPYTILAPVLYLTTASYWDHLEVSVAMKSLALSRGEALYPPLDSAFRTQLVYGPGTHLAQAVIMSWFDNPIFGSKVYGLVTGLSSVFLVLGVFSARLPAPERRIAIVYFLLPLLIERQRVFAGFTDGLLLLGLTVATVGVISQSRVWSLVLWTLGLGIAMTSKPHAIAYALPLLVLVARRVGAGTAFASLLAAGLIALLPFGHHAIELQPMLATLAAVSTHPLDPALLIRNIATAAVLVVPAGLAVWQAKDRPVAAAMVMSLVAIAVLGSKAAAGVHHLTPFAAVVCGVWIATKAHSFRSSAAPWSRWSRAMILAWIPAMLLQGALIQRSYIAHVTATQNNNIVREAQAVREQLDISGLRVGLGYTDDTNYPVMYLRPLLWPIVATNLLEPLSIADLTQAGVPISPVTRAWFDDEVFDVMVLPADGQPFTMTNWYDRSRRLFGPDLPTAFQQHYHLVQRRQYFSIWRANRLAFDAWRHEE